MVIHIQKKECTTVLSLSLMVLKIFFFLICQRLIYGPLKKTKWKSFISFTARSVNKWSNDLSRGQNWAILLDKSEISGLPDPPFPNT